jgi:tRNA threonylcarbamoyladenosine biosynthesis protein TsaE
MKHLSKSSEETNKIAKDFLETIHHTGFSCVVALQGDLGAGKTAFAQEVGKILGVVENMHSPTFVIMKTYRHQPTTHNPQQTTKVSEFGGRSSVVGGWSNLIHIDAYRLENDSELLHLGWEEIIKEPENLILIEWPENVAGIIPKNAKRINFKFIDEVTREISYES